MSLVERIKTVTPENILKLTDQELRECYFSRQKSTYSKILSTVKSVYKLELVPANSSKEKIVNSMKKISPFSIGSNLYFISLLPRVCIAWFVKRYFLNFINTMFFNI